MEDSVNGYLTVVVYNAKDDSHIAHFCAPLEMVREGYRALHMLDSQNNKLSKGACHVLARFTFEKSSSLIFFVDDKE